MNKIYAIICTLMLTVTNLVAVDYLFYGAATTLNPAAAEGRYVEAGVHNTKPYYTNGIYKIYWLSNAWYVNDTFDDIVDPLWFDQTTATGSTPTIGAVYQAFGGLHQGTLVLAPALITCYVTGTISPDATGTYVETGVSNGKVYYQNGSYYLQWWSAVWQITDTLGSNDSSGWFDNSLGFGDTPSLGAVYDPSGGYTGTATVSTNAPAPPPSSGSQQLPFTLGNGKTLINMVDP